VLALRNFRFGLEPTLRCTRELGRRRWAIPYLKRRWASRQLRAISRLISLGCGRGKSKIIKTISLRRFPDSRVF
jgi:hypothetical protein